MNSIVVLTPIRNGAQFLPTFLENAASISNCILALDDGSTDSTLEILRTCPAVKAILTNPVRRTYKGWNDRDNRQRLLDCCSDFTPDWVFWLDCDELVPDWDIPHLLYFLEHVANSEAAYAFEVHRMIDNRQSFDLCKLWVHRLHGFAKGDTLAEGRFHSEVVPERILRERFFRTKFRLLHLAGLSEQQRKDRYRKYLEVDPDRVWQGNYDHILLPTQHVHQIKPRDFSRGFLL